MRRVGSFSRTAALVALGSFAVHLLRFVIAMASGAHDEVQGQSFLGHVPPTLAAVGFALIAARLWVSYTGTISTRGSAPRSFWRRALAFAVAIASVYVAQELLESALFSGHAQGIAGVLGDGGWVAIAIAALLGPLFCLLDVGIGRLETRVARLQVRLRIFAPPVLSPLAAPPILPPGLSPLAFGLAQRPPPVSAH